MALRQVRTCVLAIAALLIALLFIAPAQAQSCSEAYGPGAYGDVDILSGAASNTSVSFTISCTGTANQTVRLCIDVSSGDTVGGAGAVRTLVNGSNNLLHGIYSDPARSSEWGAWGGATLLFAFGAGGVQRDLPLGATGAASLTLTMYGRINGGQQTLPPGNYTWTTASPGFSYSVTTAACPTGTLFFRPPAAANVWTATISPNCLVTATNVDFGSSGIIAANIDAAGALIVRCTNTTPYIVSLSNGTGGGTGPTDRRMINGAQSITYGLYQDAARTLPFGSASGTDTASGTGTGLAQPVAVYGRVPPQATPAPGTYSDTITVTITY